MIIVVGIVVIIVVGIVVAIVVIIVVGIVVTNVVGIVVNIVVGIVVLVIVLLGYVLDFVDFLQQGGFGRIYCFPLEDDFPAGVVLLALAHYFLD